MDRRFHEFGEYRIDPLQRTLWRGDTVVRLTGREFDTLWALALQAGTPIDKAALLAAVWPDTHVTDDNLRQHVRALRQKLGKDSNGQEYIRNVPNRGYYLAASVRQKAESDYTESNSVVPEARQEQMAVESLEEPQQPPEVVLAPPSHKKRRRAGLVLAGIVSGAATIVVISLLLAQPILGPRPVLSPRPMGRILTRLTSEGRSIPHVALSHTAYYLAITPDGRQLFAADGYRPTLSVVSTADLSVHEISLPRDAGPMAVTRSGKLYIGSSVDGLMVLDIASEKLLPHIMPTGGPVSDIAATPDGSKLFFAMGTAGLKRLTIGKPGLVQVSDRVSPQHLAMDPQGKRLYVSYQAGGPGGQPGHDAVEIFDPERDVSLGIVSGPPMVGGPLSVAPNGGLVLLDGLDACGTPEYDHRGCPVIPSRVFHLLRSNDRQILQSLSYPPGHGPARFLDDSRFLLAGGSLSVVDARKYTVLENFNLEVDEYRRIVVDPDGRRVYIGGVLPHDDVLVLDPEPAECLPPQTGLSLWYSGDGTFDDAAGLTKLERRGNVAFVPGRVGQAFFLDGRGGYLVAPWTGGYEFSTQDAALALYVKFAELHGEQALVYRMAKGETAGTMLLKTADDRLVFQMTAPSGKPLSARTSTALNQGKWYQIVVTKNDDGLVFYVDGKPEYALKFRGERPAAGLGLENPLDLGARGTGSAALHGWLDEVMFYNRALSAEEVQALYQARESGPCKL